MRDLKIRPGMDTPKAKLKNPAPKDADSLLKKHMDKRQQEKEPDTSRGVSPVPREGVGNLPPTAARRLYPTLRMSAVQYGAYDVRKL